MNKAREQADKLREEAKKALNALLNIPEGSETVDRFVDCVIGAAMLEVAGAQHEVNKQLPTSYNP